MKLNRRFLLLGISSLSVLAGAGTLKANTGASRSAMYGAQSSRAIQTFVRETPSPLQFVPYVVDARANFISGFDVVNNVPVPNGENGNVSFGLVAWNGHMSYGQSLSNGTRSQPALTTTPLANNNLTFGSGPKAGVANISTTTNKPPGISTSILAVEDDLAISGGGLNGETINTQWGGQMVLRGGLPVSSNQWFVSAPGRSGVQISALDSTSPWWPVFTSHLGGQYARTAIDLLTQYALRIISFMQGEADVLAGTSFSEYLFRIINNIAIAANNAAIAATGQTIPVFTQIYQTSFQVTTNNGAVALAQYEAAQVCSLIDFVTNSIIFPHYSDGLHLSNVGEIVAAYYFSRAAAQRIFQGRKPKYLKPLNASWSSGVLSVAYDVPVAPVVFDPGMFSYNGATGPAAQNGFTAVDNSGNNALSNFVAGANGFHCQTARSPSGPMFVRCGLDNLAPGLVSNYGASNNLRDSTTDTVTLQGNTYPLYHMSPAFQMQVVY